MRAGGHAFRGLVLVGFMGAGKSSVGRVLAERLGAEFIDADDRIEETSGRRIAEIFSGSGEGHFRRLEKEAIREILSVPGRVVAVGGGAFLDEENRRLLKEYAPVAFLDVSMETVIARLAGDKSRPLLPGSGEEGRLKALMAKRRPSYLEADFLVSTDDRTISEVADEVSAVLAVGARETEKGEGR